MAARIVSAHQATGTINYGSAADIDNFWAAGGSVSMRIYLDSYGGGSFGRVCGKENDGGTAGWGIFVGGTNARIGMNHSFSGTNGEWASPTDSIEIDQWYHVVFTWDKTTGAPKIYIDGESVTVTTVITPTGSGDSDASFPGYIANRGNQDRSWDGLIADLRFFDSELTADEVRTIHAAYGADAIIRSLLRRWPMSPHVAGIAANTPYSDQTQVWNTDTNVLTVNVPAGHKEGDLLVMVGFAGGTSGTALTFTTPPGWTARTYLALPSTATTPAMQVFTRPASAGEPASYALFASLSSPMIAYMYSLPGVTDSVDVATTATGTSATPSTPTATPTENVVVLRVMSHDSDLAALPRWWDSHPQDLKALSSRITSGGGSNGGGLYVSLECWDDTATGAKSWSINSSDQWGGITIAFPYGDGIEGLPLKDLSNAQDHAVSFGHVVMAEDTLVIEGG